jgi:hypothetical protein
MKRKVVIVRDIDERPLKRVLCGLTSRMAYVANPASLSRIDSGETFPVGFPIGDVFEFDETAFNEIKCNPAAWGLARPLER